MGYQFKRPDVASKTAEAQQLAEQLKAAESLATPTSTRIRELELQLAQASASVLAQEQIGDHLRAYVDKIAAGQGASAPQADN